jgi:lactoylglutathione lyase
MRIDHLSLWTDDLDRITSFYQKYFAASVGPRYENPAKGFASRFVSFEAGARLEVMTSTRLELARSDRGAERFGLAHFAISVGSAQDVDRLTARLRDDGHEVAGAPRRTGDGYYEGVVLDPDGNRVEIVA